MKKLLSLSLCLVMVLTLVACGGKSIKGTYVITQMESGGVTLKEGDATWDTLFKDKKPEEFCVIKIKDDKNVEITLNGETREATYKLDGKKLTMTMDGEDQELTYEDKTITLEMDDTKMIFKLK